MAKTSNQRTFLRGVCVATVVIAGLVVGLSGTRPFQYLEDGSYDARMRWTAPAHGADPDILIIDIDNASFDVLNDKLGRWPWTRQVWAELVRYMNQGKPRVISLDAIFAGSETPEVDAQFAEVMKAAGNVVIGYSFSPTKMEVVDQSEKARKSSQLQAQAARERGLGEFVDVNGNALNIPNQTLQAATAGLGCVNAVPDPDGTIRRVPLQFLYGDHTFSAFSVRTFDVASHHSKGGFEWLGKKSRFASNYVVRDNLRIPVDDEGRMLLLWKGGSFAYLRIPLWQVICSIYPEQCPADVKRFPAEFFHDKIVLLGASASGGSDSHTTPFAEAAPGIVIHAAAIDNLLHGEAMRPTPKWLLLLAIVALVVAGAALAYRISSVATGSAVVLALLAVYGLAVTWMFGHWHLWMPAVPPSVGLILSYFSSAGIRYATTGRELRRTRGVLDRYIAPQLVNYVLDNLGSIQLAGDKRELTILVSDVRNFTTMTEKSEPMALISLLDDYLTAMTEIIFKYNGIVDKFIGDGILAYWGAFTPDSNHALEAAKAALEMIERVGQLNVQFKAQGKDPIAIGIGVNTGTVIFGNVGKGKKIEFTVIGDAVNLTARLESLNKEYGTSIIISEATRERLGTAAQTKPLGGVKVKGKTVETKVYQLLGVSAEVSPEELVSKEVVNITG
ncbi:MAG TPA: adenylate/guanylate cyclase domain-containing protein [Terriglobales bacterium]|jgi:adenylate cyclase|nr:adenylate/guanylate cyclase domain-containing protein [Terriglobales bacterium]